MSISVAGALLRWIVVSALMCVCAAHADAISPRRLIEVVDFDPPVMSPNGGLVAFRVEQASIERNTYDTVWYVLPSNGSAPPHRVGDGGVPLRDSAGISLPVAAVWSPDGRWIYYRALIGGRIDIWRAAANGSGAEPMTNDRADVRDFSLSADGSTLNYSVGATRDEVTDAEQAEYDHGIHIDETVPIGQGLFRSGYVDGRLETQRFGKVWFDRMPLLGDVPDRWIALDLATGIKKGLSSGIAADRGTPSGLLVKGAWKVAPDARTNRVAVLRRVGSDVGLTDKPDVELSALLDEKAHKFQRCGSELCVGKAISSIQWRPGTNEVLFTVTDPAEGLAQSMFRWNVDTGAVLLVARSDGLLNGGRDPFSRCGVSSTVAVCVTAEANRPPRLERIELESGQRKVLFDPNAALAQDAAGAIEVRLLRWQDRNGHTFTGQLFRARDAGHAATPLFVTYYSCTGYLRGGLGDEWPLATLAEHGISALCINHLPGYRLDAIKRYGEGLSAVQSAIDLLTSKSEIDRSKVGMGGLSFGSEVTLWTVTKSKLIAAASVTSPSVSPNYYLFGSVKGEEFSAGLKELWGLGAPDETPDRWRALSPVFSLDRVSIPILFQMPEQEYMDTLDYVIPLMRAYRADVFVFPNEPHQKFQPKHKLAAYTRNLDWFRFWLQGAEDSDSAKKAQYARWRSMRSAVQRPQASDQNRVTTADGGPSFPPYRDRKSS